MLAPGENNKNYIDVWPQVVVQLVGQSANDPKFKGSYPAPTDTD